MGVSLEIAAASQSVGAESGENSVLRGAVSLRLDIFAVLVSDQRSVIVAGVARGGKEKEITIPHKDMGHYAGHRARMGRVLPDKLKPTTVKAMPKPNPDAT